MHKVLVNSFLVMLLSGLCVVASAEIFNSKASFAQEYERLGELLGQVVDEETAIQFRDEIATEIEYLQSRQISGEVAFSKLSADQKRIFIHRFQQNQLNCGIITRVHSEARRIMLIPGAAKVLGELVIRIP